MTYNGVFVVITLILILVSAEHEIRPRVVNVSAQTEPKFQASTCWEHYFEKTVDGEHFRPCSVLTEHQRNLLALEFVNCLMNSGGRSTAAEDSGLNGSLSPQAYRMWRRVHGSIEVLCRQLDSQRLISKLEDNTFLAIEVEGEMIKSILESSEKIDHLRDVHRNAEETLKKTAESLDQGQGVINRSLDQLKQTMKSVREVVIMPSVQVFDWKQLLEDFNYFWNHGRALKNQSWFPTFIMAFIKLWWIGSVFHNYDHYLSCVECLVSLEFVVEAGALLPLAAGWCDVVKTLVMYCRYIVTSLQLVVLLWSLVLSSGETQAEEELPSLVDLRRFQEEAKKHVIGQRLRLEEAQSSLMAMDSESFWNRKVAVGSPFQLPSQEKRKLSSPEDLRDPMGSCCTPFLSRKLENMIKLQSWEEEKATPCCVDVIDRDI